MRKLSLYMALLSGLILLGACSNTKNTPLTRAVQAFKARYNTYYNGHVAYLKGVEAQETGNKDNYTEIIPFYITGNKNTLSLGSSNYETTVTKCQKTIKQHTITKRPEWNSKKPKKPKDKIWLSQKEYNPFLYKAWFLMADAQFRKGEFYEAASTYAYILECLFLKTRYHCQRQGFLRRVVMLRWGGGYDAEDLLNTTKRDSLPKRYAPIASGGESRCAA